MEKQPKSSEGPYRGGPSPEERARLIITENEMNDAEQAEKNKKEMRRMRKLAEQRERREFIENEIAYLKLELASMNFGSVNKHPGFHRFDVKKWVEAFIAERYGRNKISNEELVTILEGVDSNGYAEREVLEALTPDEKYKLAEKYILKPSLKTHNEELDRMKKRVAHRDETTRRHAEEDFARYHKPPSIPKPTTKSAKG